MKRIYITEDQIDMLQREEFVFYDFLQGIKDFLKQIIKIPAAAGPNEYLRKFGFTRHMLINDMLDLNIITKSERIDEVPNADGELVAKRFVTYKVRRNLLLDKLKELYKDYNSKVNSTIKECDGGATSCGSAMQGGGDNPSSGQYEAPFGSVQNREFWKPVLNRKNVTNIRKNKKKNNTLKV